MTGSGVKSVGFTKHTHAHTHACALARTAEQGTVQSRHGWDPEVQKGPVQGLTAKSDGWQILDWNPVPRGLGNLCRN